VSDFSHFLSNTFYLKKKKKIVKKFNILKSKVL